jgi:hypothetical protein
VKVPRFRIASVMSLVALAALDFGAIRALLGFNSLAADSLLLGALPMANLLAFGILVGQGRPGSRPFLLGFEAFGVVALAVYVASSFFRDAAATMAYLALYEGPWERTIGHAPPSVEALIRPFVLVVLLGWPQMAFALLGGRLSRKFRIAERSDRPCC